MRISAKQKEMNRLALLSAAVDVIRQTGFADATLRQISTKAGMSDPVIYSYFPNKQSLLFGYLQNSVRQALSAVAKVPNLTRLGFADQVQLLMEAHLEVLERDKDFVRQIFPLVFVTGLATAQEALGPCRQLFASFVGECLDEAVRAGEFAAPPFKDTIVAMFWDFHVGILHYWLQDGSDLQSATSEMMQRSMAVIQEVLKSGFLPRLVDLAYFLIRTHLLTPQASTTTQAAADKSPTNEKSRPKILDEMNSEDLDG